MKTLGRDEMKVLEMPAKSKMGKRSINKMRKRFRE